MRVRGYESLLCRSEDIIGLKTNLHADIDLYRRFMLSSIRDNHVTSKLFFCLRHDAAVLTSRYFQNSCAHNFSEKNSTTTSHHICNNEAQQQTKQPRH